MPDCAGQQYRMYSPSFDLMMQEVTRTLGNIGLEHQIELKKVDKSAGTRELELKQDIGDRLGGAHRERRQHYVDLLSQLWVQPAQSFAA